MNNEELYRSNFSNAGVASFVHIGADDDFQNSDAFDDDTTSYSEENFPNLYTVGGNEDRRLLYKPTTSRQADEEDQHVELFEKNILGFPRLRDQNSETDTIPSCSYDHDEDKYFSYDATNTGFAQSDLTGSSSSTSRHARIDYAYSNQCEYVSSEFPQQKRSSSFKMLRDSEKKDTATISATMFHPCTSNSVSSEDSVLQVTDCSSPEYSEPSK